MTDEELLAEAYRRFPIGTRFISHINDKGLEREIQCYKGKSNVTFGITDSYPSDVHGGDYYHGQVVYCSNGLDASEGGCSNPALYLDGQWVKRIGIDDIEDPISTNFDMCFDPLEFVKRRHQELLKTNKL